MNPMPVSKKVAGSNRVRESWGPALKESGLDVVSFGTWQDALQTQADCILLDMREPQGKENLQQLKSKQDSVILSVVKDDVDRRQLEEMKNGGASGYLSENTPAEEVAVRLNAMMEEGRSAAVDPKNMRAAQRVWFQQEVEFKVFDRSYKAWSTTLSETGIFLRTSLSFPLYSVIQLKFYLLGDTQPFVCDGVIVRQEVEGPIRGIGVMFQNLKGENVRRLESYLDLYR